MKFGAYLEANMRAEWADSYLDYSKLKKILKILAKVAKQTSKEENYKEYVPSLSIKNIEEAEKKVTYNGEDITEEDFFVTVDQNLVRAPTTSILYQPWFM